MTLVLGFPAGLWALTLLVPVVVLHVLHRKPPNRIVSTVRLYKTVEMDTGGQGRLGRPDSLLAVLDALVVAALALAAAGPTLVEPMTRPERIPVVLLDRSASMGRHVNGVSRLSAAVDRTARILFDAGIDRFHLYEVSGPSVRAFSDDVVTPRDLERLAPNLLTAPVSTSSDNMVRGVGTLLSRHNPPALILVTDYVGWPKELDGHRRVVAIDPGTSEPDGNLAITNWTILDTGDDPEVQLTIAGDGNVPGVFPLALVPLDPDTGWAREQEVLRVGVQLDATGATTVTVPLRGRRAWTHNDSSASANGDASASIDDNGRVPAITARLTLDVEDGYRPDNTILVHFSPPPFSVGMHPQTPPALKAAIQAVPWVEVTEATPSVLAGHSRWDVYVTPAEWYRAGGAPSLVYAPPEAPQGLPPSLPIVLGEPTWLTGLVTVSPEIGFRTQASDIVTVLAPSLTYRGDGTVKPAVSVDGRPFVVQFADGAGVQSLVMTAGLTEGDLLYRPVFAPLVRDMIAWLIAGPGSAKPDLHATATGSGGDDTLMNLINDAPVISVDGHNLLLLTRSIKDRDGIAHPGLLEAGSLAGFAEGSLHIGEGLRVAGNISPVGETVEPSARPENRHDPGARLQELLSSSLQRTVQAGFHLRPVLIGLAVLLMALSLVLRFRRLP